jgi:zinc protease
VVTTVLSYRVGAAHEQPEISGAAHFLEHMMFKGSAGFGPGEIDRRTQLLGGWNNAFTSHDATAYIFGFASDRWEVALAIEADRMRGLILDPEEVDSERKVIGEEISMYLDDPWDSLELEVHRQLFGKHPYGRPILGNRESLAEIDGASLRRFHTTHYRPWNAVLAIAGDVRRGNLEEALETHFGEVGGGEEDGSVDLPKGQRLSDVLRVEKRRGSTGRFILAMSAPPATDPDYARLVFTLAVLGGGRSSRLHRRLVEDLRLCSRISADATESVAWGLSLITGEALPGADPAAIERVILEELARLREELPSQEELARAHSMLVADWIFGHERIHQQALLVAMAETLFDSEFPARHLRAMGECSGVDVMEVAQEYLSPSAGAVVGWSLAEGTG